MMSARIEDHFASDPITGTFGDHPTEADQMLREDEVDEDFFSFPKQESTEEVRKEKEEMENTLK